MLKGKQKNLDANKDGKISGDDFAMLRKRKKMMDGGPVEVKADNAVDMVGNPKGKKKPIQIKGWGKAIRKRRVLSNENVQLKILALNQLT
jgi:hypothetical protein